MSFRHPHSEQRRPARAHAVGPVLGSHARTDRNRDTRVAEPRLPAPKDGRPGEGQRLTPDAPHNGGRSPPPGTAPHHPRGTQPPQGMQAKGTVLGPYTHTPAPIACEWRTPTARPVGGHFGEGERLTTDAPHNSGRHPPRERPSATPTASNAGPQGRTLWGRCWVPRPHRPHPGHTGRGTPAARPRGRAAGGGTAPDTRRPSQRWPATPPGDGPELPPRHAAPTGHAGQGHSDGPPHPHARARSTWVTDPNNPPSGRAVGGRGAPDLRRPSGRWKAPPAGRPFRQTHSEQRRPARAHAVGPLLGPHARTDRTRVTRVAEPRLPAPEGRRLGEGQRLTPDAPHNGGRPPPPGTAPHHPRGTQPPHGMQAKGTVLGPHTNTPAPTACEWRTPTARPVGGQFPEGVRLTTDAPQNCGRHPPGNALPPPPQRATPARKGARCGAGAGSPRPHGPHPGRTGRGTPAARPRGRAAGGGTAPDTRRSSQRWQASPLGTAPHQPRGTQPPQGTQAKGTVLGPHTHTPAPTASSQVGGNRDRTAPPQAHQTEQGTGAGHAEGHGPHGTALPAPSAGTARGAHATPPTGGGSGCRGSASAHTRKGHAGTTRRATGPSSRNAQTAWNGVPASEGKGHPDEMARHTQRRTRGAGRGKRERHNTRYQHEPPEPAARAASTRTGHCTCQGSSGALRHAPTPRPAQGGRTGDKRVARARRRRRPGRSRIRGATRWVSARSHGCELMH